MFEFDETPSSEAARSHLKNMASAIVLFGAKLISGTIEFISGDEESN